jgi:hypothetical protein
MNIRQVLECADGPNRLGPSGALAFTAYVTRIFSRARSHFRAFINATVLLPLLPQSLYGGRASSHP